MGSVPTPPQKKNISFETLKILNQVLRIARFFFPPQKKAKNNAIEKLKARVRQNTHAHVFFGERHSAEADVRRVGGKEEKKKKKAEETWICLWEEEKKKVDTNGAEMRKDRHRRC